MTDTTTRTVTAITGRYSYDRGLSGAAEANESRKPFEVTRCGLDYAMDWAEYESIELHGSRGRAGAYVEVELSDGSVLAVGEDGYCEDDEIAESDARAMLTEDGIMDADEVDDIRGDVWDGNNHTTFEPSRCLRWLDAEDRTERGGCVWWLWSADGDFEDAGVDVPDDYTSIFNSDWSGMCEESLCGTLDYDQTCELLDKAGIKYKSGELTKNDEYGIESCYMRAVVVHDDDLDRVRSLAAIAADEFTLDDLDNVGLTSEKLLQAAISITRS